jgi:hypothetical protein
MPKPTFFNLPEEKRSLILDLAIEEFAARLQKRLDLQYRRAGRHRQRQPVPVFRGQARPVSLPDPAGRGREEAVPGFSSAARPKHECVRFTCAG